ncbi:unnamed protein product [Rotaria sordida]|uniref:Uncharacterized protein n=1 Tax=Rotaria sordida TaxID=392033 RepID=A0A813PGE0_9BILA|nr:unnamed protein product [Rotaria sordida]CAF0754614.1 unnamed protein product [Rotaria sordida]CAF0796748.1 unnamed protein product [Rotaria sordida]CAF0796829.1 unnamed protein product [Rotaria sordida]CAF0830472.1 unnamed protein product [Rotaria sordida]
MGNDVKSRLHMKKHERGHKHDGDSSQNANSGRNEVDETIMSGPNRARAIDPTAAGTGNGSGTTQSGGTSTPVHGRT